MTSPCVACDSLADCATCLPRLAWEGAQMPPDPAQCPVCQDTEWLLLCGETLDTIAPRILNRYGKPFRLDSLVRHLQRERRWDLLPPGSQRRVLL